MLVICKIMVRTALHNQLQLKLICNTCVNYLCGTFLAPTWFAGILAEFQDKLLKLF